MRGADKEFFDSLTEGMRSGIVGITIAITPRKAVYIPLGEPAAGRQRTSSIISPPVKLTEPRSAQSSAR